MKLKLVSELECDANTEGKSRTHAANVSLQAIAFSGCPAHPNFVVAGFLVTVIPLWAAKPQFCFFPDAEMLLQPLLAWFSHHRSSSSYQLSLHPSPISYHLTANHNQWPNVDVTNGSEVRVQHFVKAMSCTETSVAPVCDFLVTASYSIVDELECIHKAVAIQSRQQHISLQFSG